MNLKGKLKRNLRILRNIYINLSRKIYSKINKVNVFSFINRHKYIITILLIVLIFISKNFILINKYSRDINEYKTAIAASEAENKQLKADLKYYSTDEFVYRYAMSELNMRPTKPSKWVHIEVHPANNTEEDTNNTDNNTEEDTNDTDNTTNNTEEDTNNTEEDTNNTDNN